MTAKRRAERKQFKIDRARAIAAVAAEAEAVFETEGRVVVPALSGPAIPSAATWKPAPAATEPPDTPVNPLSEVPLEDEEPPEDLEHLQLTLPEAFFLLWNLNCLTVTDPHTVVEHNADSMSHIEFIIQNELMNIQQIWIAFQAAYLTPQFFVSPRPTPSLQFDNPFLINYIVYHHYRSLGWVVRGGIKFCVDYMLYKRGPVFNHAE
jgi:tRNA-splicing endonuclease subunit Sen2